MTVPGVFSGFGPLLTPVTVEVRIDIDQLDPRPVLTSLWFKYSAPELRELRTYLAGEVANRDGAVSIWTDDDTERIVPSRTIRWLTITTRPLTPGEGTNVMCNLPKPDVAWSSSWGLLIRWPNDRSMWVNADDGRDFGEILPDDAVNLVPQEADPSRIDRPKRAKGGPSDRAE